MGFEPRAAERLRMAVSSAGGALDDIAHMIGTPTERETQEERDPGPAAPRTDPPHDPPHDPLHRSAA